MEKHKEVFFVIRLHSAQSAASLAVSIIIFNCYCSELRLIIVVLYLFTKIQKQLLFVLCRINTRTRRAAPSLAVP